MIRICMYVCMYLCILYVHTTVDVYDTLEDVQLSLTVNLSSKDYCSIFVIWNCSLETYLDNALESAGLNTTSSANTNYTLVYYYYNNTTHDKVCSVKLSPFSESHGIPSTHQLNQFILILLRIETLLINGTYLHLNSWLFNLTFPECYGNALLRNYVHIYKCIIKQLTIDCEGESQWNLSIKTPLRTPL